MILIVRLLDVIHSRLYASFLIHVSLGTNYQASITISRYLGFKPMKAWYPD